MQRLMGLSGLFTYASLNLMIWLVIKLSRGTIVPKDYEQKEYWTWKPGGEKPWIIRIFIRFWRLWINRRSPSRNTEFSLPSGADGAPSVHMQPSAPSREKLSERTSSPSRLSGTE
jgi:adenine/guanine/hypoxanthine permease